MKSTKILVQRLYVIYDPFVLMDRLTITSNLRHVKPIVRHRHFRDSGYDRGRVKYFMDRIKAGKRIEPIDLGEDPVDDGPIIIDGHHRFIAHLLTKQMFIRALNSLDEHGILWLAGHTNRRPKDWNWE